MAALTDNVFDNYRPSGGMIKEFGVAVDIIYRGALVVINAAGFLAPGSDTASEHCAGVALDEVDNSGGSAGDETCRVDIGGAEIKVTHEQGSMTAANIGDAAKVQLDNEVADAGTSTNDIHAGAISEIVSGTVVWVKLAGFGILS